MPTTARARQLCETIGDFSHWFASPFTLAQHGVICANFSVSSNFFFLLYACQAFEDFDWRNAGRVDLALATGLPLSGATEFCLGGLVRPAVVSSTRDDLKILFLNRIYLQKRYRGAPPRTMSWCEEGRGLWGRGGNGFVSNRLFIGSTMLSFPLKQKASLYYSTGEDTSHK